MAISDPEQFDLLDQLAEEFAARFRRGERPTLEEYTDRYPELADDIREFFPAMVLVEQADAARPLGQEEQRVIRDSLAANPLSPRQIGDYRILREIGRGGMGVVYEAEQVSLGRRVALKVLPGQVSSDRLTQERFRREARAAARLHHTNIVPVYDVGQDGDVRYYAMQFIEGQGLDSVITEMRRLMGRARSQPRADQDRRAAQAPDRRCPNPTRPGDDRPEGDREGAGSSLPVGRRDGRGPASVPRRRADRGAAGVALGTGLEVGETPAGDRGARCGVDPGVRGNAGDRRHLIYSNRSGPGAGERRKEQGLDRPCRRGRRPQTGRRGPRESRSFAKRRAGRDLPRLAQRSPSASRGPSIWLARRRAR